MARTKRTRAEREHDLNRIARLYLQGKTQAEIAEELGLSQQQISYDLKTIYGRWREDTAINLDEAKCRELARIDLLERTYWEAWQRSLESRQRTRTERGPSGDKASVERQELLGDPRYLAGIQWCIAERIKLLGLYAPIKTQTEVTGRNGGPIQTESLKMVYYEMPPGEWEGVETILREARAIGGAADETSEGE